jgi:GMP synthase-like glutamine amidotransferase
MKPVLILQNMRHDGPAYLATWLARQGIAHELVDSSLDQPLPSSISAYAALAVLGGAMSANDPLPFLRGAEQLILQAMDQGRPVIGHCLGGQLMAKALGAQVAASPAPEIGWQPLQVMDTPEARAWFGAQTRHLVMHWHYESFGLPPGAQWLAKSDACPHQAFSLGPHLAMQFHVEIDEPKLQRWLDDGDPSWADALAQHGSTVQSKAGILADASPRMATHQRLADQIYGRWLEHVRSASAS